MAERAAQLVVKDGAPRIMACFDPGWRDDDVAGVRQGDGAAAQGLNGKQDEQRNASEHDLLHTPAAVLVLPRA